jgi:hypothetical protein
LTSFIGTIFFVAATHLSISIFSLSTRWLCII